MRFTSTPTWALALLVTVPLRAEPADLTPGFQSYARVAWLPDSHNLGRSAGPDQRIDQIVRFGEFFQRFIVTPAQPVPPPSPETPAPAPGSAKP